MMEPLPNRHDIHSYVESLAPGTRVVWIPNGTLGTVQSDKSVVWDNGHHLTRKEMTNSHALLIFSNTEKDRHHEARVSRANCLKRGCKLEQWNPMECKEQVLENCCPLAIIRDPEFNKEPARRRKARAVRSTQQISA